MTKHYSEADLLETYYMEPEEASAIIEHVNGCSVCQDRYRRLGQKLRDLAACPTEKPATFWTRQRLMIMRAIDNTRVHSERVRRVGRMAAAAMLVFLLGGVVAYKTVQPKAPTVAITHQTVAPLAASDDLQVPRDPWQSDELKDFGTVVQWESWVDAKGRGSSL
jgi:predicted anti-sigma-YlaC factor YlaD